MYPSDDANQLNVLLESATRGPGDFSLNTAASGVELILSQTYLSK